MIDENAARSPGFDEERSVQAKLPDGQSWWLRMPTLRIRPRFEGGRAVSTRSTLVLGCSSELEDLLAAVDKSREDGEGDFIAAVISVAAMLLAPNYTLSDAQLEDIFGFDAGVQDAYEWVKPVMMAARGLSAPKGRTGDGSSAPS